MTTKGKEMMELVDLHADAIMNDLSGEGKTTSGLTWEEIRDNYYKELEAIADMLDINEKAHDTIRKAAEVIKKDLGFNEWVSVKNQLPKERTMVDVWQKLGKMEGRIPNIWLEKAHGWGYWYESQYIKINGVTHWLPLPKPPNN